MNKNEHEWKRIEYDSKGLMPVNDSQRKNMQVRKQDTCEKALVVVTNYNVFPQVITISMITKGVIGLNKVIPNLRQ